MRLSPNVMITGLALGVLLVSLAPSAQAQGWGSVKGQFVLDGPVPNLPPLIKKGDPTAKDPTVCAIADIPDDSLRVDPQSKGIRDIVVYLRKAPASIHPDLMASEEKVLEFDQKGCRFYPHILPVRTDQQVKCVSSDAASHNVNITPFSNKPQNFIVQPNDQNGALIAMPLPEIRPTQVKCDIHAWMRAYWVITDHPYVAVTDEQGRFTIENLPVGRHEFIVWQDASGYVNAKGIVKGKLNVDIKSGETVDLGVVKVAPSVFAK